jgi:phage gp36-like protein
MSSASAAASIFGGTAFVAKEEAKTAKEEAKTAADFASGTAFLRYLKRQRTDAAAGPRRAMTAQKLLAAVRELRDPMVARLLDTAALDRALREASALEPYLRTLCKEVGAEAPVQHDLPEVAVVAGQYDSSEGTVVAIEAQTPWGVHAVEAERGGTKAAPDNSQHQTAIEQAASKLDEWLLQDATPLRAILTILGGSGAFFAAHTAEKTARAWALRQPSDLEPL